MVQERTVWIISLLAYFAIFIMILIYTESLGLGIGEWIQLFLLLVALGVFMLSFIGQILNALRQPRLKIIDSGVESHDVGTKDEFKGLYFVVKNEGKAEAQGCRVKVKIKGITDDFEVLNPDFPSARVERFNIDPNERKLISLCRVEKKALHVSIPIAEPQDVVCRVLERGQIYEFALLFFGKNIDDRQIHRLRLDLSSWENIGITLDC